MNNINKIILGITILVLTAGMVSATGIFQGGNATPECYCGSWVDGTCKPQCGSPPRYSCDCDTTPYVNIPFTYHGNGGQNCHKQKWTFTSTYQCTELYIYESYYVCGCLPRELTCNWKAKLDYYGSPMFMTRMIPDCIFHPREEV